jgi:hypothetical protein
MTDGTPTSNALGVLLEPGSRGVGVGLGCGSGGLRDGIDSHTDTLDMTKTTKETAKTHANRERYFFNCATDRGIVLI